MSTVIAPTDAFIALDDAARLGRFVFRGVDWEQHRALSEQFSDRHIRLTYDRGTLEFMTISPEHSYLSRLLLHLVTTLTRMVGMPRRSCKSLACVPFPAPGAPIKTMILFIRISHRKVTKNTKQEAMGFPSCSL